jgi:hypothetical protein
MYVPAPRHDQRQVVDNSLNFLLQVTLPQNQPQPMGPVADPVALTRLASQALSMAHECILSAQRPIPAQSAG